jgi:hypothetical protein
MLRTADETTRKLLRRVEGYSALFLSSFFAVLCLELVLSLRLFLELHQTHLMYKRTRKKRLRTGVNSVVRGRKTITKSNGKLARWDSIHALAALQTGGREVSLGEDEVGTFCGRVRWSVWIEKGARRESSSCASGSGGDRFGKVIDLSCRAEEGSGELEERERGEAEGRNGRAVGVGDDLEEEL